MRRAAMAVAVACALLAAPAAVAQIPIPELPPIGGQPPSQPPGGQPPKPPPPVYGPAAKGTVATGGNPARTGFVADYTLVPPLKRRWSVKTRAEYLLAAGGRVFEIGPGKDVRARDNRTGRLLWHKRVPGEDYYGPEGAAYDRGVVFVQLFDDLVAMDAKTGKTRWKRHLTDVAFATNPVAAGGVVYAYFGQGGGHLLAFRVADGQLLWSSTVPDGSGGAALDANRAFVAGACANAMALARPSGNTLWSHRTGCSGGGDVLARVYNGRVYVPDEEYTGNATLAPPVLDADDGKVVGRLKSYPVVFDDGVAIANEPKGLTARRLSNHKVAWRARKFELTAPLAVGHSLVGISKRPMMGDAASGLFMWSGGRRVSSDPYDSDSPPVIVAAAGGMLFAGGGGRLDAYRGRLHPKPRGISLRGSPPDLFAGDTSVLTGRLGSKLRVATPSVEIEAAPWRHGRFRHLDRAEPARDGGFRSYARTFRNTRVRAAAAGRTGRATTVYAYPAIRLGKAKRRNGRVYVGVRVRSPRTNLVGKTFYLYVGHGKHARLVAGARLRGHKGRAHTVVSFRPLRHVGKKDLAWLCVRGALQKDLGRPDDLGRHCGAGDVDPPG